MGAEGYPEIWQPSFLGAFCTSAGQWSATVKEGALVVTTGRSATEIPLSAIRSIEVGRGSVWPGVMIHVAPTPLFLKGLTRARARELRHMLCQSVSSELLRFIESTVPAVREAVERLNHFYRQGRYLANRDVILFEQSESKERWAPSAPRLFDALKHPLLELVLLPRGLENDIRRLQDLLDGERHELAQRNESFVQNEILRWDEFFDNIESRPLTDEQRRTAILLEDRNLLIAAAGSGKTSALVAKIGYALVTRFCTPRQILGLAFNASAATELRDRVVGRLGGLCAGNESVASRTFHRLGMDIIATVEGKQPDLAPWAGEGREDEGRVIRTIIQELLETDPRFLEHWVQFQAICFRPNAELPRFATRLEYDIYLRQVGEEQGGRKGIRTLQGDLVKSMEEVAIANWLYMNGVPYEYERAYQYATADSHHRQYHPDFYLPDIDCYCEHFALDQFGKAPAIFASQYEEGVRWKRMLHATKQTALIETTSAMYRAGDLFSHLERELRLRHQVFRPRSPREILECLAKQRQSSHTAFIRSFITLCKSRSQTPAQLRNKAQEQRDPFRALTFLSVVSAVFERYQDRLTALGCIDFEDMIQTATRYIQERQFKHPYQLILVDEFQDISYDRATMLCSMLDQNPDCRLFAVGDDWQSIYRFAGADIEIMSHFASRFGVTATTYLTRTFRSNQGITDVAAAFVQRNPAQLPKTVEATDSSSESTIEVLEYDNDDEVESRIEAELISLADHAESTQRIHNIFVLGRYNHLRPSSLNKWKRRFAKTQRIEFLSLHRSKGLEADYVFILGVNSGQYSFPSMIMDDPLLDLLLPTPESFANAEERRLFYVGLTRAKHKVYLLTKRARISHFIPELLASDFQRAITYRRSCEERDQPIKIEACPSCGTGVLRPVNGPYGPFLGCSNYPDCTAKKQLPSTGTRKPNRRWPSWAEPL